MRTQNYRDPTAAEYAVVREVYTKTGIMAVKDAVTAGYLKPQTRVGGVPWEKPWQGRPEYGEDYRPNVAGQSEHEVGFAALTRHRRAVRIDHFGTPLLPNGIAVGGVEVWVNNSVLGDGDMKCVRWQSDLGPDEEERLHRWARNIHHVTDSEYTQRENEAKERESNRAATQVDPAGALVKALAPALAQLTQQQSGPSPEELAAAGFVKGADGKWTRPLAGAVAK